MKRILKSIFIVVLCLSYFNSKAQPSVLNLNAELNSSDYSIHPNYVATEAINAQPGTHAVAINNTEQIHLYISSNDRKANPDLFNDSTGKDLATKYSINVYPNPTSQNINITISALTNGQAASVYLFNEQGKSLFSKEQTTEQEMIEFSNLSSGIYQLRVVINSEQVSYRIVKL